MNKKPMRWRRARFPDEGTRWSTPMNRHIWYQSHGQDIELWQGDTHLVTLKGRIWTIQVGPWPRPTGTAKTVDLAKKSAKESAKSVLEKLDAAKGAAMSVLGARR